MSDALFTGLVAILVCIINNWVQFNKTRAESDKNIALIQQKLDELSARVDRHNQVIERTYKLEEATALQDAELHRINRRLEIVEGGHHE